MYHGMNYECPLFIIQEHTLQTLEIEYVLKPRGEEHVSGSKLIASEPTPEATRLLVRVCGAVSHIAPTTEADGASSEEEENEAGKGQPEGGTRGGGCADPIHLVHLVLHKRKQCDLDDERDKGDGSCEEGDDGREEGDGDVLGHAKEERHKGDNCGDGGGGEAAGPGGTDGDRCRVGWGLDAD